MKVFLAGARNITNLDIAVKKRLVNMTKNNISILVGDANGVDKEVQEVFKSINYNNVIIYAMRGKARNNIGDWKVMKIEPNKNSTGFEYYATKDLRMAQDADYGFMIWNGKSKGTYNNIMNLLNLNKKVLVYFNPDKVYYTITDTYDLENMLGKNKNINSSLAEKPTNEFAQI